jgi:serine/threonine protein kinase
MGSVYLAHDSQLHRNVALKVPRFGTADSAMHVERFYREARAMATLRHPNLCAVHDVGQHQGIHFLTMDYVEGQDLAGVLKDTAAADALQVVDIIRKIALALAEAHQAGIVHRDLKPSNIMLDRRGEPMVMDFGLARREQQGEAGITHQGAIVGSPAYMPPEQVAGEGHAAGPTADVYSLGVVFYQLLCRRLPFEGTVGAVLAQVLTTRPGHPRTVRASMPGSRRSACAPWPARPATAIPPWETSWRLSSAGKARRRRKRRGCRGCSTISSLATAPATMNPRLAAVPPAG